MAASAPVWRNGSLSLNSSYSANIWVDSLTNSDAFCRKNYVKGSRSTKAIDKNAPSVIKSEDNNNCSRTVWH